MKTTIFIAICAASMCCCGSGIAEPNAPVAAAPLFPVEPPIKDADPQVRSNRTFQVPTRLIVKRTPERIEVSVDMNSLGGRSEFR